jgi:hypothetical protein
MIVKSYLKMWPRAALDLRNEKGHKHLEDIWRLLRYPGVYILYRDDQPYYIGRSEKTVGNRIYSHAIQPRDRYYNFWNFFSVFLVPKSHIEEVEGILIAAFPTENAATPKFKRLSLPRNISTLLHKRRLIVVPDEG